MPDKKPRRGGRPTYTPETAARRAAGALTIRIDPELARRIRLAAASHPGGVTGWLAAAALAALDIEICPEGLQIRYPAESQIRSEVLWSMPGAEEAILRAADLDPGPDRQRVADLGATGQPTAPAPRRP